ncbi:19.5g2 protein [Bracoviriform inaniti]|uniref:19.5g2 protein n=1 Tax=Bracoviriform inaniti TaxID=36344 RepID=A8E0Z7_9VIRU|nr:19.5g2 protein [Bracoviriform inaniti]CAO98967.1 19.5g2 protein [Bracoviriform inaniti]
MDSMNTREYRSKLARKIIKLKRELAELNNEPVDNRNKQLVRDHNHIRKLQQHKERLQAELRFMCRKLSLLITNMLNKKSSFCQWSITNKPSLILDIFIHTSMFKLFNMLSNISKRENVIKFEFQNSTPMQQLPYESLVNAKVWRLRSTHEQKTAKFRQNSYSLDLFSFFDYEFFIMGSI